MVGYGKLAVGAALTYSRGGSRLTSSTGERLQRRRYGSGKTGAVNTVINEIIEKNTKRCETNAPVYELAERLGNSPSPEFLQQLLRAISALGVALALHLASPPVSSAQCSPDIASASEDKLLELSRIFEAHTDSFWSGVGSIARIPWLHEDQSAMEKQKFLVEEVYDVVLRNFDDSRNSGFNQEDWKNTKDRILAKHLSDSASTHSAIREMLLKLKDPYSRFLSMDEFSAMSKYDISGVGLNLGTLQELEEKTGISPIGGSPAGAYIVGLIRSSPADTAGLKQGDQLLSIDGEQVSNKSPFEVASLLQVPAQESDANENELFGISKIQETKPIRIAVKRTNGNIEDVQLMRPPVFPTPSPVKMKFDNQTKTGYVKLSSFNARAQRDIYAAVKHLESQSASKLVLDLRGNRGGLVSEGIEVAKLFLDNGDVIVRSKVKARSSEKIVTSDEKPLTKLPLVVLVDGGTASASEILAGALQDNCRAPLVGQKTYGKGLIQSVYELSDGSGLVLTVGSYLTPSGINIDWEGLTPDFKSVPSDIDLNRSLDACKIARRS